MSIAAYAGEFTVSPIPLEMSMNFCSHKCAYCFANLNQPNRRLDINRTINQIKNCHKSKSLTSYLLKEGYPVLLSNRVDPFATTNYRQTLSFIEILYQNGNPIAFQTKGGQGIDEALSIISPSCFYISIGFYYDNYRHIIEPGAPSIQERLDLIEKLISNGHHVSVGINPLVEEWLPTADFELLVDECEKRGVKNFWVETLHLNSKQVANMTAKEQKNIGGEIIDEAKKRNRNISYFMYAINYLREKGFNVFSMGQPFPSAYFNAYGDMGYKTIPTHQEFINYCFEKYPNGGEIKFKEYYSFMAKSFYELPFSEADGYAYRIARNVYREVITEPLKTLKQVLQFYWENPDVSKSLAANGLFSVMCYKENGKTFEWQCKEDGMLVYYFHAAPKNEWRIYVD